MVVQALKQVKEQAKAAMNFSPPAAPGSSPSARPGLATRPTASPQLTPRTEKEQLVIPVLEPSSTGTAASAVPQGGQPQPTRKPPNRAPTVDDRSSGGHGPPPQPQAQAQAQPLAQSPPQPPPGLPHPPSAFPTQLRPQPPPPGHNPRSSVEYPAPPGSRPYDGRPAAHEKNHHQREEPHQHEVDDIDAYFRNYKRQLDKRQAVIEAAYAQIKEREDNLASLEERVHYFESEPYRQEVLSIRKHMQINDMQEVSTITEKFRRITRKVEDISRDLGEKLSDSQAIREPKTIDLVTVIRRRSSSKQSGDISVINLPMDPEDFIDFGCRALLNDWLVERICGPNIFHPALAGRPENELFLNTYRAVRSQESQTIAGRWRVSTFNTIKSHGCDPQAIAQDFCQNALTPLCDHVYKPEAYAEPVQAALETIAGLFKSALDWTCLSKTSVVMLDFQPGFSPPGSQFDPQGAQLEGPGKKIPGTEGILLTSKLGLYSSRARGAEGADHTVQVPAKVLTAQYFS